MGTQSQDRKSSDVFINRGARVWGMGCFGMRYRRREWKGGGAWRTRYFNQDVFRINTVPCKPSTSLVLRDRLVLSTPPLFAQQKQEMETFARHTWLDKRPRFTKHLRLRAHFSALSSPFFLCLSWFSRIGPGRVDRPPAALGLVGSCLLWPGLECANLIH